MPKYFESFPKIEYQLGKTDTKREITDITKRVGIRSSYQDSLVGYYTSVLTNAERPEVLAYKVYKNQNHHWILMLANNIVDPIHDWVMQQEVFEEYIDARYPNNTVTLNIQNTNIKLGFVLVNTDLP